MYNINNHINVKSFFKKLPGGAGNVPLVLIKFEFVCVGTVVTNQILQFSVQIKHVILKMYIIIVLSTNPN